MKAVIHMRGIYGGTFSQTKEFKNDQHLGNWLGWMDKNQDRVKVIGTKILLTMENLIDKKFDFVIGSTTLNQVWNKEDLTEQISKAIQYTMFDWDFYYNWTDNKDEYLEIFAKKTLAPMIENVEQTFIDWFEFDGKKLTFKSENVDRDKWFMETSMSKELRKEYTDYRLDYAGINLN